MLPSQLAAASRLGSCPTCSQPLDVARAPLARVVDRRVMSFCSESCYEERRQAVSGRRQERAPSLLPPFETRFADGTVEMRFPPTDSIVSSGGTVEHEADDGAPDASVDASGDDIVVDGRFDPQVPSREYELELADDGTDEQLALLELLLDRTPQVRQVPPASPSPRDGDLLVIPKAEPAQRRSTLRPPMVGLANWRGGSAEPVEPSQTAGAARDDYQRRKTDTDEHTAGESVSAPPQKTTARRRKASVIAASAAMVGGMSVFLLQACPPAASHAKHASAGEAAGQSARVATEDNLEAAPALATPAEPSTLERAVATLDKLMTSDSSRIRRVAAKALSRTGGARAVDVLGGLLEHESSPLVRVDIAYGLARAGNARGVELLKKALGARLRDVRLDAAKYLVWLDEPSGKDELRGMLSYRQYRISAAGLLARLGDKRGKEVLTSAMTSAKVSSEIKMRAAVALGMAGDAAVAEDLRQILARGRHRVGAAVALARLADPSVVDELENQLRLPHLRVRAALSLRRLQAGPVARAQTSARSYPVLMAALSAENEVNAVTAAEALIILHGSAEVAKFD